MRVCVVVESGNHAEELCKVWFTPFEHDMREPTTASPSAPWRARGRDGSRSAMPPFAAVND